VEQAQRFHQQAIKEQQTASVLTTADKKPATKSDYLKYTPFRLMEPLRLFHSARLRLTAMLCDPEAIRISTHTCRIYNNTLYTPY